MSKAKEITYWIITFTSIDGGRFTYRSTFGTVLEFKSEAAAKRYAKTMPNWQEPVVSQMWDMR